MIEAPRRFCFVVPALDGPISGGTLYNRELCAALVACSCEVAVCSLSDPRLEARLAAADHSFVDTLYLAAFPELARLARKAQRPLALLSHYLPTLVAAGRVVTRVELSEQEARALGAAHSFLVTSPFMREALEPLVAPQQNILVVEPGSRAHLTEWTERSSSSLRALAIANLLPGKGIAPLLDALGSALRSDDRFQLSIVGRLDADPVYAEACARSIALSPELASRVTLRGALEPEATQAALTQTDLFVSASTMESYGMALAEARVSGVPIVACAGGHAAAHVDAVAGGQLVASPRELAAACLQLARDPDAFAERRERARRHAPPARSWSHAARALLAQLSPRKIAGTRE